MKSMLDGRVIYNSIREYYIIKSMLSMGENSVVLEGVCLLNDLKFAIKAINKNLLNESSS